jgi:hypothetical protein
LSSRTTLLKRAAATVTAAGVALTGAVVLTTTAAPAEAAIKRVETPFAYQGSAYGTRVSLGDPNQGGLTSGPSAWSVLGCTAVAPTNHGNHLAKVGVADGINIGAVDSVTSDYRKPKQKIYGSRSVNKVADITLGQKDGPRLRIKGVTTVAHAYNVKGRFRATADIDLAGVDLLGPLPSGDNQPKELQQLLGAIDKGDDQLVEAVIEGAGSDGIKIPGLGTVKPAGSQRTVIGPRRSMAGAYGIRVILDNGSRVDIGRAWAKIESAHPAGVFTGNAYAVQAVVGNGVLGVGKTPFQPLPCTGTNGKWRTNALAQPKSSQLDASALKAETFGNPMRDGRAVARARSAVADIVLGGGALEVQGVVGQVNVFQNKRGQVVRRTTAGTRVGAIIANGKTYEAPAPGQTLEIPGVATIQAGLRQNLGKRGLRVHALQVKLLDGTGLVLNLGTARAKILR